MTTTSILVHRRRVTAHAALYLACAMLATSCATTDDWFGGPSVSTQYRTPGHMAGVQPGYYRVNVGDTIASVAAGFSQTPQNIAEWNRLPLNAMLAPGQVLRVVPPAAAGVDATDGMSPVKARFSRTDVVAPLCFLARSCCGWDLRPG